MYTLVIANKNYSSWSLRPWMLMRELGIPFTEHLHPFEGPRTPAFKRFSPSARVPALRDGERVVWDSLAITEYLAERHPGVWPEDEEERTWARCATAEMHSGFGALRTRCSMSCGIRVRLHEVGPALQEDLDRLGELWTDGLERFGGPFLAGRSFSAVDAFFGPVAFRIQSYGLTLPGPALAYAERLRALPSMVAWYEAALAETWREEGHDAEVLARATLLADLRQINPAS